MSDHYFVSYSRADGGDVAASLADQFAADDPSYRFWIDVRELEPGQADWDDQIADAIQSCNGLLFVMTPDSTSRESGCKDEWAWALKYKKPVVPLRLQRDADLPFRLSSRQYIDFTGDFNQGVARLRIYLRELHGPKGELRELRFRLGDAERELPRTVDAGQRARVEQDLQDLRRRIGELEGVAADPAAAAADTEERIAAGLEGTRHPARPEPERPARAKFVNPPPVTAPTYFQDRHVETELLANFLAEPDVRLVTVLGRGGVGKTAMVCRLLKGLESGRLPDDLGEQAVDGIVYLRTPSAHPVSFANLFADVCRLLPNETADRFGQRYRDPHQTPAELMAALLEAIPADQTVVVLLDNFEDLLDESGTVADSALDEGLRALLSAPAHGVKVVVTTRVAPRPLLLHQPGGQRQIDLDEGLASPYAERLLRARDPDGRLGLKTASDAVLAELRERTRGYPRALEAVAAILSADRDTSLPELLAETERLPENVVEALVGDAYQRLDALTQQVMQALAIFPVPVPPVAVDYVLQPFEPAINAAPVLTRLVNMQFVRRDAGDYYLHQVDRDYALGRVPAGQPADRDADPPPFTRYALWDRAADYFTQTETPRQDWKTLDDLAPQLAQFGLRCQGADYDTAAQVLFTIDFDYLITWGHYRYVIDLHISLQDHLTDPSTTAASLNNLGSCHYSLGNGPRAIEFHQQALTIYRQIGNRGGEAAAVGNLGNCYADLGQTQNAIELHKQALTIYRENGDLNGEAAVLGNLGRGYAALGQIQQAIDLYQQALTIARNIGSRHGEAIHLGNIGSGYSDLGQTQQAIELAEQALLIDREIGDRRIEAIHLGLLGDSYADLGQNQQAIELHQQALTIYRDIGNRRGEADQLSNLGRRYADLGQNQQAIELHQQALTIYRDIGNRAGEADQLSNLGYRYADLGQNQQAIELHQQALTIYRDIGNRRGEADQLSNLGRRFAELGQIQQAIELFQQALAIYREVGDRRGEAGQLSNLGYRFAELGQIQQAIELHQQALTIYREVGDRRGEADQLSNLGRRFAELGQIQQAIELHQQALTIDRDIGNRAGEADQLSNLGRRFAELGQIQQAIELHQQALTIDRDIGNRGGEADQLANLARRFAELGQNQQAIELYEQALSIDQESGDRRSEASRLSNLGYRYAELGQIQQAIELFQQALTIYRDIGNRAGEADQLSNLGYRYAELGQIQQAIELHQQALTIYRDIGNRGGEADQLANLARRFADLGQNQQAIELYEQALSIDQESGDRRSEASRLSNLGYRYAELGQIQQAIELFQQALTIYRDIGNRGGEADQLSNLGRHYAELGQIQQAIELHQQALTIYRDIGEERGEAEQLGNLSYRYVELGQTEQAIELHQQALTIYRDIGDRRGEADQLGNLGYYCAELGQTEQAIQLHQQALSIAREIGDRHGEAVHLDNLGYRYAEQGQTQLAIEVYEQVLTIDREIGYRRGEAIALDGLGLVLVDLGRWDGAVEQLREAVHIGDAIGGAQAQAEAGRDLAWTLLHVGDLQAAVEIAAAARDHLYRRAQAGIALVHGIIFLRLGNLPAAAQALTDAVSYADRRLATSPQNYDALDIKALALAGLSLTGPTDQISQAAAAFHAARAITTESGITARVLRRLDTLGPADSKGILHPLQSAATGHRG